MNILSFRHSVVYVTMIMYFNLIECMGDIAVMSKICKRYPFYGNLFILFLDLWSPDDRMRFSRRPKNDYLIPLTLNHVCNNDNFDSMYG